MRPVWGARPWLLRLSACDLDPRLSLEVRGELANAKKAANLLLKIDCSLPAFQEGPSTPIFQTNDTVPETFSAESDTSPALFFRRTVVRA